MSVVSSDAAPAQSGAENERESRALQLLVVDDDATQRTLIALAAKQAGHVVTEVAGRDQAMEAIRHKHFDCISLDLMLDDGDGMDVLKTLSEARFTGAVVVISGTDASRRSAARLYAKSIGVDLQSLRKPIDVSALRVYFANLGKTALGLPVVHSWGGVAADSVAAEHRS